MHPACNRGRGRKKQTTNYKPQKQTTMKTSKMTTRKFNMIRKYTYLDNYTFKSIFLYLESVVNLDAYTARQVADMMEICYEQHNRGYDQCAHENSIY